VLVAEPTKGKSWRMLSKPSYRISDSDRPADYHICSVLGMHLGLLILSPPISREQVATWR